MTTRPVIETPRRARPRIRLRLVATTCAALALVACSGDDGARPTTYVIDAVDFDFDELPATIAPGSRFELTNSSPHELHELVAFRLPDGETRSVDDILADDPAAIAAGGPPALVLMTPPGGEQVTALGDGTLTEPGRYAVVCMIPTGVDPDTYLAAAAAAADTGGPPELENPGAPHAIHGMFGEVVVTA